MGGSVRRALMIVTVFALMAGCSRQASPTEAGDRVEVAEDGGAQADPSERPSRSRTARAAVHVRATGAADFSWSGEQDVVITRAGRPGLAVNLLSAGFAAPEILPDARAFRFRWAFDLLNAYADRPGTFTIGSDAVSAEGLKSLAFLVWMKVKDPTMEAVHDKADVEFMKEFLDIRRPCTVEIGEGERTGRLTCPELATKDGEVIGLSVRWSELDS